MSKGFEGGAPALPLLTGHIPPPTSPLIGLVQGPSCEDTGCTWHRDISSISHGTGMILRLFKALGKPSQRENTCRRHLPGHTLIIRKQEKFGCLLGLPLWSYEATQEGGGLPVKDRAGRSTHISSEGPGKPPQHDTRGARKDLPVGERT